MKPNRTWKIAYWTVIAILGMATLFCALMAYLSLADPTTADRIIDLHISRECER